MRVRDGVLSSGRRGDDRGGAVCRRLVDPVTYTWGDRTDGQMFETIEGVNVCVLFCVLKSDLPLVTLVSWLSSCVTPPLPPTLRVKLSNLLFFSFSLMTMTSSPLDLLQGGLVLASLLLWMSCSLLTCRHGSEMGAWLEREASWSSSDGCSSPDQMAGHGIMFTAMLTANWSLSLWCSPAFAACSYTWGAENGFNQLNK